MSKRGKLFLVLLFFLAAFLRRPFFSLAISGLPEIQKGRFYENGRPLKFIGVNGNDLLDPKITDSTREQALKNLSEACGVSVIRFVYPDCINCEESTLLKTFNLGSQYHLRFLVSLGDTTDSGKTFFDKDSEKYKKLSLETISKLKDKYLKTIFGWEIFNEASCGHLYEPTQAGKASSKFGESLFADCSQGLYSIMKNFSQEIKKNDPGHLLFNGLSLRNSNYDLVFWPPTNATASAYLMTNEISAFDACQTSFVLPQNPNQKKELLLPKSLENLKNDILVCQSFNKPSFVKATYLNDPQSAASDLKKALNLNFETNADGFIVSGWQICQDEKGQPLPEKCPTNKNQFFFEAKATDQICQILKNQADQLKSEITDKKDLSFPTIPPPGAGWTNLSSVIGAVVRLLITIAALLTLFYLIIGGLRWIISGGDAKKTEAAGKQITNALIGLGIVAAAWAVMVLLEKFFNISVLGGPISFPVPQ